MTVTQKITPSLWFDMQAEEAATFYTSLFKNAKINTETYYGKEGYEVHGMPEGAVLTVDFQLEGQNFIALNGGPSFKFTPAISFFVTLETEAEADALWKKLVEGGTVLMPFQTYDWSEKYGWLNDRYGLSWQIGVGSNGAHTISPSLLFVGEQCGKAEEALRLYESLFGSNTTHKMKDPETGHVQYAQFTLAGQTFTAMDSAEAHVFSFNEAVSLMVTCETQEEIDDYWDKLSAVPEAEQCGWLKDKFGVSWQIVPSGMNEMLNNPDRDRAGRAMQALLQMKKINIEVLEQA